MSDLRDTLKSMLNNYINDKPEEASLDFHSYVTAKMKQVAGITPVVQSDPTTETTTTTEAEPTASE